MLTFKKNDIPNLKFRRAIKKPIAIRCIQIDEPFKVETLEGTMQGQKGDWLMVGVHGEMYPIDNSIFEKTYNLLE
jgi:hypothetical protein